MEYRLLVRHNPTDENLTKDSSVWLASRIMPGKGNDKISFSHFLEINETGMRTADFDDLKINGLIAMNDDEKLINVQPSASSLVFNGLWTINNQPVIGHATVTKGLVAPFNTFNMGYRYKRGWRPSNVN